MRDYLAKMNGGDEDKIRERLAEQFQAGASHVSIIPLNPRGGARPDERVIEALAPLRSTVS